MKHIKLFEELNEELIPKFSWKRQSKVYGKSAIGNDNEKRAWELYYNGNIIAWVHNSGYTATSLGGNDLNQWSVMFNTHGANTTMAKKFEEADVETAKKWAETLYTRIINSTEAEPNLFKIKERISIPVKVEKLTGPFKGVIKKLKEKMGSSFNYYIGTDNTYAPLRYGKDFDATGKFHWTKSGKPDREVAILTSAIGDEYEISVTASNSVQLTKKT